MIVPMKKVSIVVLDSLRKESVKALRKMGVVHLETMEGSGEALAACREAAAVIDKAISILAEIKLPKKQIVNQVGLTNDAALNVARKIASLSDEKKTLFDKISQCNNELERLSEWGDVDPNAFADLAEKGIFTYMYEIPEDMYALIGDDVETVKVNSSNKVVRFLHVSREAVSERPTALPPEAYAVPLPEKSTKVIRDEILAAKQTISRIESELSDDKKYANALVVYKKVVASDIEYETVYSGMGHEEDSPESAETVKLAWLTGYVPADLLPSFEATCKSNEWAYLVSDPAEDDPVPTKLHNNKLVSIIYPLMDFLDVTPGYHEFDISGWFLLFFCVFFGMIFADAGYGALIALLGFGLLAKSKEGKRSLPVLVTILGLCTMVWGTLTCSWFGIEKLPEWMVNLSFTPVSKAKMMLHNGLDEVTAKGLADKNQQIFCFLLALVQLSIAHIKCAIADRKTLKCLGDWGSLFQLWGTFYVVLSMVVDSSKYKLGPIVPGTTFLGIPLPTNIAFIALGVLFFGFALNFVFSNYDGSIGRSVLESCKNIISVFLGIVNVFSDIVSYIRLWAVALAGAAISGTVNQMAGPMFGKLTIVVFAIILLVFGHGLNMMLNLLSVIVHGVRLNTLEFSQHLGMNWSGTKYRPFSENPKS